MISSSFLYTHTPPPAPVFSSWPRMPHHYQLLWYHESKVGEICKPVPVHAACMWSTDLVSCVMGVGTCKQSAWWSIRKLVHSGHKTAVSALNKAWEFLLFIDRFDFQGGNGFRESRLLSAVRRGSWYIRGVLKIGLIPSMWGACLNGDRRYPSYVDDSVWGEPTTSCRCNGRVSERRGRSSRLEEGN